MLVLKRLSRVTLTARLYGRLNIFQHCDDICDPFYRKYFWGRPVIKERRLEHRILFPSDNSQLTASEKSTRRGFPARHIFDHCTALETLRINPEQLLCPYMLQGAWRGCSTEFIS